MGRNRETPELVAVGVVAIGFLMLLVVAGLGHAFGAWR